MAAAYDDNLMMPGFVELSHTLPSRLLICAHAPTRKQANFGTQRYRITYAGLAAYLIFLLCLFFCVKSGLAPSGGGEIFASTVSKGGIVGVRLETAAQKYSSRIALSGLPMNVTIYLLNSLGVRLVNAKSTGGRILLIIINAVAVVLLVYISVSMIKDL